MEYFYFYHINTVVIDKSVIDQVGGFDEDLMACEDTDFLLRVFIDFKVCFIRDYHFIYHHGDDNIYAFLDRKNINVDMVSTDRSTLDKMTKIELCKIKVRTQGRDMFNKFRRDNNHTEVVSLINESIADKLFTLGYLNRKLYKQDALGYYLRSIKLDFTWPKFVYLGRIIFPGLFNKIKVKDPNLNLW